MIARVVDSLDPALHRAVRLELIGLLLIRAVVVLGNLVPLLFMGYVCFLPRHFRTGSEMEVLCLKD